MTEHSRAWNPIKHGWTASRLVSFQFPCVQAARNLSGGLGWRERPRSLLVPKLRLGNPVREAAASRLHHQAPITSIKRRREYRQMPGRGCSVDHIGC